MLSPLKQPHINRRKIITQPMNPITRNIAIIAESIDIKIPI